MLPNFAAEIARRGTRGTPSGTLDIDLQAPFKWFAAASLIGSILALLLIVRPAVAEVDIATLKTSR